ncbi:MAG: hypothetical protein AB1499_05735 [Nitrospirota bacterium]
MINEISNINDHQGQVNKPNNRQKDLMTGVTHADTSSEFDTKDVVEISRLQPVQPVTDDKNDINFSPDAKNAEKNGDVPGTAVVPGKKAQDNETAQNDEFPVYGKTESSIGKFIDTVV